MIPVTGPVTVATLRAELGLGSGPISSFLALPQVARAAGRVVGSPVKISDLRGAHLARTTLLNANLYAQMGSPAAVSAKYRFVVEPGVAIGSNSPTDFAADSGQFPAGSTLNIDVYGGIEGAGGQYGVTASHGSVGQGGGALYAPYANQSVVVNVKPVGALLGGGGAGGTGGAGGAGGQGGPGSHLVVDGPYYARSGATFYVLYDQASGSYNFIWNGASVGTSDSGTLGGGSDNYAATGGAQATSGNPSIGTQQVWYAIQHTTQQAFGAGGAGGGGGSGGPGGRGQGYDGGPAAGAGGTGGQPGQASPGNGAGAGGAGGAGGQGGTGGGWGGQGGQGSTGAGGAAGAAGAGGGPAAGNAGAAGATGGQPGYYIYRNGANVTLTTQGTVQGITA